MRVIGPLGGRGTLTRGQPAQDLLRIINGLGQWTADAFKRF